VLVAPDRASPVRDYRAVEITEPGTGSRVGNPAMAILMGDGASRAILGSIPGVERPGPHPNYRSVAGFMDGIRAEEGVHARGCCLDRGGGRSGNLGGQR